jgi:GH43 family beta-xylosidase
MNDASLIEKHGKGYGEGEIIRYALANSVFLRESEWFVKCTAKLWVDNFLTCLKEWNGQFVCKAFFADVFSLKATSLEYVDTRFYMVTKDFYVQNFSNLYVHLGLNDGSSIEGEFLKKLLELNIKGYLFRTTPVISGVGGGSGQYYNTSSLRRMKEVVRSKLVSRSLKFQDLFIQP